MLGQPGLGRYQLVASALAGRLVEVAPSEGGVPPWTDGLTIFVASDTEPRDLLRAIAVQASLLRAGSLTPTIGARLGRRNSVARRYLAIEGHRALAAQDDLLPPSVRSLVDERIAARSDSPEDSVLLAESGEDIADPPPAFGTIRPRELRASTEPQETDNVVADTIARSGHESLRDLDDEAGDDPGMDLFPASVGRGGPIGRLLKKLLGDARSGGSGPPGMETATHSSRRSTRVSRYAVATSAAAPLPEGVDAIERRGTRYPEWDVFRRRYRADWCTVLEADVPPAREASPAPDGRSLRRPLARLGLDLERRRRELQGAEIDIDAAVDALVQRTSGTAPDDAIYIDSLRARRDLSVLVLLDCSGSAGEPSASGPPVHELQRAAAAALTSALHDLGDRVALYGFRSQGRTAVHVLPVKRFENAFDAGVLARLGALEPGAYTRLGAAIRHGSAVLEAHGGTPRRLLVVLSDGFAYDHGYSGEYGEADARRALAEARRRGTGCLCLSIGASTDVDALRRVFGTAAHASLPRVEMLHGVVGPLFRAALRSADVQRRAWQRTERTRERLQIDRRTA